MGCSLRDVTRLDEGSWDLITLKPLLAIKLLEMKSKGWQEHSSNQIGWISAQ